MSRRATMLACLAAGLALSACAATTSPERAIHAAAAAAPLGVPGDYGFRVAATGRRDGNVYLNSELDYRDQRNLTVTIQLSAIAPLAKRLGGAPDLVLRGKKVLVKGQAYRVRVDFTDNGVATGKYYYQTHVVVSQAEQLKVIAG